MSQPGPKEDRQPTLVVGLDIGTTFSGLAFQLQNNGSPMDVVREVRGWPCPPGYSREADQVKVPTKLDYSQEYRAYYSAGANEQDENNGDDDDDYDRPLWGYLVVDDTKTTIEWPKLLLLGEADLPSHLQGSGWLNKSRKRAKALRKTAPELLADYIRQLWRHAVGDGTSEGYIDRYLLPPLKAATAQTHVVVTIPAIWKNDAVKGMKMALADSILGHAAISYEFMSEPEAGMMALAGQIRNQMQVDDVAVCLDLGGGTADCISYRLMSDDRLAWEEVVPGDGSLCGAKFLDEAFHEVLRQTLRNSDVLPTAEGWRALLRNEWEYSMKRGFEFTSSPTDRSRTIKLSTVTEDSINLHDRLIRKAFNSVTTQILELVQHQVEQVKKATDGKLPRAILVVGGFGRCPFVRGALKHKFSGGGAGNGSSQGSRAPKRAKKSVDNAIHIMSDTGEMPWTAICRGAVLAKLADNSRIESRKARMSFGFVQSVYAAEGEEGTWDNLFGRHMVKNAMTWILRRGDSIAASDKILQQTLAFSASQTEDPYHEAQFYAHRGEEPPARFKNRDPTFEESGMIKIHVPVALDELPLREDETGGESRVFDYDLHINSKGESIHVVAFSAESGDPVGKLRLKDVA